MPTIPDWKSMLQQLIAIPSVSSVNPEFDMSNRPVIDAMAEWLESAGFHVAVVPVVDGKFNLIATLGSGSGGLLLAGHTDTVPCDEGNWTFDPFSMTEQDNRLYGLGVADMKAFLALAVDAASQYSGRQFAQPLTIVATADEESSMSGARALAKMGKPAAQYAVIGEPTGLVPVRMHKGVLMEAIVLSGKAGHASNPALGINALDGMQRVMSGLMRMRQTWQEHWQESSFEVRYPTLNLGYIKGGDNPNRICAECELHIDVRLLPGMGLADVRSEIRDCVETSIEGSGLTFETRPLFDGVEAFDAPASGRLVKTTEALTGMSASAVAFATEAPYFNQLCSEVIVLGPGDIDLAHKPDESLPLDRIEPTISLLKQLIERFCIAV